MFTKLLVPLDGSSLAEQALGRAAAIARVARAEIDLALARAPAPIDTLDSAIASNERNDDDAYLRSIARELATGAAVPVGFAVVDGRPAPAICTRARTVGADLIVMTSHGRTGLRRVWAGSVADEVIRHSSMPVLLLRAIDTKAARRAAHHLFTRVVVLLDGTASALEILGPAAALARCGGGRVTLLRVVQPIPLVSLDPSSPFVVAPVADDVATRALVVDLVRELTGVASTLAARERVEVDGQVLIGHDIAKTALHFIAGHGADVVAMITHGRGASRLIAASIVDDVVRKSGLPVLVLRAGNGDPATRDSRVGEADELRFALA